MLDLFVVLFYVAAFICFLATAFGRAALTNAGLACLTVALFLSHYSGAVNG